MSEPNDEGVEKGDNFCFCLCFPSSVAWQSFMGTSRPGALLGTGGERSQWASYLWDADSPGREKYIYQLVAGTGHSSDFVEPEAYAIWSAL